MDNVPISASNPRNRVVLGIVMERPITRDIVKRIGFPVNMSIIAMKKKMQAHPFLISLFFSCLSNSSALFWAFRIWSSSCILNPTSSRGIVPWLYRSFLYSFESFRYPVTGQVSLNISSVLFSSVTIGSFGECSLRRFFSFL